MTSKRPRVSVAIPLYRSAPFVDNVSANIETLPSGVEILISDRHRHDDAMDQLQRRHGGDRRVRFLGRPDGKDWIDHINILLREARADYWRLMPHDDFAPPEALPALVRCLDEHPETLLAYGPTTAVDLEGNRLPQQDHRSPHPLGNNDPWTLGLALDTFWRSHFNGAFKGLLRRREVIDRGLWIRRTFGTVYAERLWLSALALIGRFRFVNDAVYIKRFHPSSTHARWRPGVSHELSAHRVLWSYARDHVAEQALHRFAHRYISWTTAIRLGMAAQPNPQPNEPAVPDLAFAVGSPIFGQAIRRLRVEWTAQHQSQITTPRALASRSKPRRGC